MEIDTERIDQAVLALLLLGLHEGCRVWKSFDWDAMDRLHKKGFISDPVGKAKSVVLTEEGQREAERLFAELFEAAPQAQPPKR
jgi:DNA-binding PadR family transcriptional regulator